MTTRPLPAISLLAGVVIMLFTAACSPASTSTPDSSTVSAELASVVSFDLAQFSGELAAAVAVQNGEAFDSEIAIEEAAVQGAVQLVAFTNDQPGLEEIADAADAFDQSLAAPADATFDEQTDLLDATAVALDAVALDVNDTLVSVAGASAVVGPDGTSEVVVDLHIVRSLSSGIDWEEVVPYVTTVDSSSGAVLSMEVHDDAWIAANPPTEEAAAPSPTATITPDVYALPAADAVLSSDSTAEQSTAVSTLTADQRNLVVRYALKYWSVYNPAYISSSQDCTNFAL